MKDLIIFTNRFVWMQFNKDFDPDVIQNLENPKFFTIFLLELWIRYD